MNDRNLDHRINVKLFVKFGNDASEMCTRLSKAVKEYVFLVAFTVQIGSS
jgi:hypothetical protein